MASGSVRYSRWDGTQTGPGVDADALLGLLGDDIVYRGDVEAALRRALHAGVPTPGGDLVGLRSMLDQLRRRRGEATERGDLDEISQIDQLGNLLRGAGSPEALELVDLEVARELLGEESSASLAQLARLRRVLEDAGLVEERDGRPALTPAGIRAIGSTALAELFRSLDGRLAGGHEVAGSGAGTDRSGEVKRYEVGDPFHLDVERTVRNAIARGGGGVPLALLPEDFEVELTERSVRTATVLLLDLSLSMPARGNLLPAKKVALALHALISSRYPRDFLGIVGFSEVARVLEPWDLPSVSWDAVYGTNIQHALALARQVLSREHGTRQVVLITDGEPTAHVAEDGEVVFDHPPTAETLEATLREVARCAREGIRINTFVLDPTPSLCTFVERLTTLCKGRAFFTTPTDLGSYVLIDHFEQRRRG